MSSLRPTLLVAAVLLLLVVTAQAVPRALQQQQKPAVQPAVQPGMQQVVDPAVKPDPKDPICTCKSNPMAGSCTTAVAVSVQLGACWPSICQRRPPPTHVHLICAKDLHALAVCRAAHGSAT
jgi:hypothetical protein